MPDSKMLTSKKGPSKTSTRTIFEEISRLAEELQKITSEDKERIREALNGLYLLKVRKCEIRQHLEPLENLLNVFYQYLSHHF